MTIGYILKELRTLKKVSQQQITDRLNIERSTYAKWETDKIMLRADQLINLSNYYGIGFELMARCVEVGKIALKMISKVLFGRKNKKTFN